MHYNNLISEVEKLRNALLPDPFDELGDYEFPEIEHVRTVSFRILVHAQIEVFIEERSLELFNCAWNAWVNNNVPSRALSGLLMFSSFKMSDAPRKLKPGGEYFDKDNDILARAKKYWLNEVYKKNHGIKEKDVLALLLPLGIDKTRIDNMLLVDLDNFGNKRGAFAHNSSFRVTNHLDPRTEYNDVIRLLTSLGSIDALVEDAISDIDAISHALQGSVTG